MSLLLDQEELQLLAYIAKNPDNCFDKIVCDLHYTKSSVLTRLYRLHQKGIIESKWKRQQLKSSFLLRTFALSERLAPFKMQIIQLADNLVRQTENTRI